MKMGLDLLDHLFSIKKGECTGVLCSIIKNSQPVCVKPFEKIKPLLDVIILQEQLNK